MLSMAGNTASFKRTGSLTASSYKRGLEFSAADAAQRKCGGGAPGAAHARRSGRRGGRQIRQPAHTGGPWPHRGTSSKGLPPQSAARPATAHGRWSQAAQDAAVACPVTLDWDDCRRVSQCGTLRLAAYARGPFDITKPGAEAALQGAGLSMAPGRRAQTGSRHTPRPRRPAGPQTAPA